MLCVLALRCMSENKLHIKTIRLFDFAQDGDFELTEEETKHFLECKDCQQPVIVFALLFGKGQIPPMMLASRMRQSKAV